MHLYYISDEQRMVRDLARTIAREKIAPVAAQHDEAETYPRSRMRLLAQQGLMGIWRAGGLRRQPTWARWRSLVAEEIAWACAATATNYLVQSAGGYPIVSDGTEAQKRRYLPAAGRGRDTRRLLALGARRRLRRRAHLRPPPCGKGDRYVLNGSKLWCTNGSTPASSRSSPPSIASKGPKASPRSSSSRASPASRWASRSARWASAASPTVALHLTDCEVPVENRLGEEGEGFRIAHAGPRLHAAGDRRPGGRDRPGGAGRRLGVRPGAPPVRPAHRRVPGHPVHAGRHGDAGPRRAAAWSTTPPRLVDRGVSGTALEASMAKCFAATPR